MDKVGSILLSSREIKAILNVSDCTLMHMRTSNELTHIKKGNAFYYTLPANKSLLTHPLGSKLLNWHKGKHAVGFDNTPVERSTQNALELLVGEILLPLEREFGGLSITYGFTSFKLKNYIAKNSPKGTAPNLDQHASCELNSKGDEICARDGAACDLIIEKQSMANIVRFITSKLNYDRIYYYGQDRPLHVSANASPARHLQVMKDSPTGRRYPASKGFGTDAIKLAETL